jgi:predicted secreted protein
MSDESIQVQHGDQFEVVLREPPATGHRWRVAGLPSELTVIDERYEAPQPGGPLGSAGRRIVTLRANDAGRHRLKFELARADEAPADEHFVDVEAS